MQTLVLDSLFGPTNEDATFHDATVREIAFNVSALLLTLRLDVFMGQTEASVVYREGVLTFRRVHFLALEPQLSPFRSKAPPGLWLTADGPVSGLPKDRYAPPSPPHQLPADAFFHYLYFSDTNSFLWVAASEAAFVWSSPPDPVTDGAA